MTCCFTGPRPQNLPWSEDDLRCKFLKLRLEIEIRKALESGYRHFISGMALGIDLYAAHIILNLRRDRPELGITLEAAIPCNAQSATWEYHQRIKYNDILLKCDKRTILSARATPDCFQKRNEYMVNQSSLIIAVSDGRAGGTMNTIAYAKQQHKEVIIIKP